MYFYRYRGIMDRRTKVTIKKGEVDGTRLTPYNLKG